MLTHFVVHVSPFSCPDTCTDILSFRKKQPRSFPCLTAWIFLFEDMNMNYSRNLTGPVERDEMMGYAEMMSNLWSRRTRSIL